MTDSPNCVICGQIETVAHQFVECRNAKNLWEMYRTITGKIIRSMLDVIICTESIEIEIAKTITKKSSANADNNPCKHTYIHKMIVEKKIFICFGE